MYLFVTLENAMWTLTLQFMATGAEWGTVSFSIIETKYTSAKYALQKNKEKYFVCHVKPIEWEYIMRKKIGRISHLWDCTVISTTR